MTIRTVQPRVAIVQRAESGSAIAPDGEPRTRLRPAADERGSVRKGPGSQSEAGERCGHGWRRERAHGESLRAEAGPAANWKIDAGDEKNCPDGAPQDSKRPAQLPLT